MILAAVCKFWETFAIIIDCYFLVNNKRYINYTDSNVFRQNSSGEYSIVIAFSTFIGVFFNLCETNLYKKNSLIYSNYPGGFK